MDAVTLTWPAAGLRFFRAVAKDVDAFVAESLAAKAPPWTTLPWTMAVPVPPVVTLDQPWNAPDSKLSWSAVVGAALTPGGTDAASGSTNKADAMMPTNRLPSG